MKKTGYKTVYFEDRKFLVLDEVYEPAEDTFLIAENLRTDKGNKVLDMGTGCGILAVVSASEAAFIVAVDINPYAVKCAKLNAKINGVMEKIEVLCGDLFSPLKEERFFDLVIFNAPYLPTEDMKPKSWMAHAWSGGKSGRELIERFITFVPSFLCSDGRVLLVQSTLSDVEATLSRFRDKGFKARILVEHKVAFETISLMEAVKTRDD